MNCQRCGFPIWPNCLCMCLGYDISTDKQQPPTEAIKAATSAIEHCDGKTEYVRRIEKWLERVTPKDDTIDKVVEFFDGTRELEG